MSTIIGIDYGSDRGDMSVYTVAQRKGDSLHIIDSGKINDFDYTKYVATEHQVIGEKEHLEKFKAQFMSK